MCNLSQGIKEEGIAIGEARGRAIGEAIGMSIGEERKEISIILTMHKKGFTIEQIADATDKSPESISDIIEKNKMVE